MNNYIPSGTSLFDILSMIIPGGLIIAFIADLGNLTVSYATECSYPFIFYALYFVLSYLVGLVWSVLMDALFKKLRNNQRAILCAKQSWNWYYFLKKSQSSLKDNQNIDKLYLEAYYKVAKNSIGNVIIILETQVAFIRNMILIVWAYGICLLRKDVIVLGVLKISSSCIVGSCLIVFGFLLVFVMISRQHKIYYLIWEGEQYISDK